MRAHRACGSAQSDVMPATEPACLTRRGAVVAAGSAVRGKCRHESREKTPAPGGSTSRSLIGMTNTIEFTSPADVNSVTPRTITTTEMRRQPRKVGRLVTSAVAVAAMGIFVAVGTAAPASAADRGVSIAAQCARYTSAYIATATNINGQWNGWRCETHRGLVGVDVQAACNNQGGGRAVLVNGSASGWRCRTWRFDGSTRPPVPRRARRCRRRRRLP